MRGSRQTNDDDDDGSGKFYLLVGGWVVNGVNGVNGVKGGVGRETPSPISLSSSCTCMSARAWKVEAVPPPPPPPPPPSPPSAAAAPPLLAMKTAAAAAAAAPLASDEASYQGRPIHTTHHHHSPLLVDWSIIHPSNWSIGPFIRHSSRRRPQLVCRISRTTDPTNS